MAARKRKYGLPLTRSTIFTAPVLQSRSGGVTIPAHARTPACGTTRRIGIRHHLVSRSVARSRTLVRRPIRIPCLDRESNPTLSAMASVFDLARKIEVTTNAYRSSTRAYRDSMFSCDMKLSVRLYCTGPTTHQHARPAKLNEPFMAATVNISQDHIGLSEAYLH